MANPVKKMRCTFSGSINQIIRAYMVRNSIIRILQRAVSKKASIYACILLFTGITNISFAQTIISGSVKDNLNRGLADATTYIKGTMNSTTADSSGH